MYQNTITIFNFHDGVWYPSIVEGANLVVTEGKSSTAMSGQTNSDSVEIIIHSTAAKMIETTDGAKAYVTPKAYAKCTAPANCVTFTPEQDFIYDGAWPSTEPIPDEGYDTGLYSALNEEYDGIYMISNATYFGLLPHFEIGGR